MMTMYTDTFDHAPDQLPKSASAHFVITPHQSLSREGASQVAIVILVLAGVASLITVVNGLWPISLFVSIDSIAFVMSLLLFRKARAHRMEEIVIGQNSITVRRSGYRSPPTAETWPCFGMSVVELHDPDFGCRHLELRLRSQRLEIARDLSPVERKDFARALCEALREYPVFFRSETFGDVVY